jgi:hypothetical protein
MGWRVEARAEEAELFLKALIKTGHEKLKDKNNQMNLQTIWRIELSKQKAEQVRALRRSEDKPFKNSRRLL